MQSGYDERVSSDKFQSPSDVDLENGRLRRKPKELLLNPPYCGFGWWIVGSFIGLFALFIIVTWAFAT